MSASDSRIVELTLSSDVATSGTFTVGYPSGTTKGTFSGGKDHAFICQGAKFTSPEDFTISFGATSATITYSGTTTLLQGAKVTFQFDTEGETTLTAFEDLASGAVQKAETLFINLGAPIVADIDNIIDGATGTELPNAETVTYTRSDIGSSPCDGANSTWRLDVPRNLVVTATHGSSIVACTVGITGRDVFGATMYELFTVTATGTSKTVTGVKAFYDIDSIAIYSASDSEANTIEVGIGSALGLPVYIEDQRSILAEMVDRTILAGEPSKQNVPFQITEAEMDAGGSFWVLPGFPGNVIGAGTVVENTVTTGGSITFEIGGTAVDGLAVVIADSAVAGEVDTGTATAGHASRAFTASQPIEIVVPAAFNASAPVNGFIECERTTTPAGTLTLGLDQDTPSTSATTDVRGLYTPSITLDGVSEIGLLVAVTDPSFRGNDQAIA